MCDDPLPLLFQYPWQTTLYAIAAGTGMGKDYYGILGVPKDADETAVKKAYRRVSQYSALSAYVGQSVLTALGDRCYSAARHTTARLINAMPVWLHQADRQHMARRHDRI